MTVYNYNYDRISCEYLSSTPANLDVMETEIQGKEVYISPAYSTRIAPPAPKQGYATCFNAQKQKWEYAEDHRGQIVYKKEDLSEFKIEELGPIAYNLYLLEKPEPKNQYQVWNKEKGEYTYPSITELKLIVKSQVDSRYNDRQGVCYPVGSYFVQPQWASIYTSTLLAMQIDAASSGRLKNSYKVMLITNPLTATAVNIEMHDINDFMPYYTTVKELFKNEAEVYHDKLVIISASLDPEEIISVLENY